jgi:sec-independent protein translocase protein TatA
MVVIFLVALLLFGPKKLPELGKTLAKAVSEFRRAQSDLKATFEREMKSLEAENESLKEVTRQASIDIGNFSDFDLTGASSSTYGAETHPANAATDWHGVESGAPTTVSASEIPGAESHGSLLETTGQASTSVAEASPPAVHAAEETVARGTVARTEKAAPAAVAEAPASLLFEDPLHETRST